jgi:hypothetical protein
MGKSLSSYWKKRAPHKKHDDYVDDARVIWNHNSDLPLIEKTYIYEGQITPNRMIKQKNVYEITFVHPQYIINGFSITTGNNFVEVITLFGFHPNRDPNTNLYCLPDYKKGIIYTPKYYEMLLTNIKTYYLDNCFFIPATTHVIYKKMKSVYMQMNKGD